MSDKQKLSQAELNDALDSHKSWWDSRNDATSEIWEKATQEQRTIFDKRWVNEQLKNYSLKGTQLYLKDLDLSGLSFTGRDMMESSFAKLDLTNSNFEKSCLKDSFIKDVNFSNANLRSSTLDDSDLENVDFTGANLVDAKIMLYKTAKHLKFDNAKLNKAKFIKSPMDFVSFKNALLIEASFRRVYIADGSFENANCSKADFTFASISNCNGKNAIIDGADFNDARDLPEEWKQKIGWYSEEEQLKRRVKAYLKDNP